jgi:hypothetical protein
VRRKFADDRAALPIVKGPGGAPAYSRKAVFELIDSTQKEFDQAVLRVKEPRLAGLQAWADEALEESRHQVEKPTAVAAFSAPRAGSGFTTTANGKGRGARKTPHKATPPPPSPPAPPKPDPLEATTIGTSEAQQVLGQVGRAIERIFFLADKNDLEVKLWVGSTPAEHATFRFWPKSSAQGAPPAPTILTTDAKKDHVLRGLYEYRASATLGSKAVTEVLESGPGPAGSAPSLASERLDLVNGSSFFCCRFNDNYCHHVENEKECQAERR